MAGKSHQNQVKIFRPPKEALRILTEFSLEFNQCSDTILFAPSDNTQPSGQTKVYQLVMEMESLPDGFVKVMNVDLPGVRIVKRSKCVDRETFVETTHKYWNVHHQVMIRVFERSRLSLLGITPVSILAGDSKRVCIKTPSASVIESQLAEKIDGKRGDRNTLMWEALHVLRRRGDETAKIIDVHFPRACAEIKKTYARIDDENEKEVQQRICELTQEAVYQFHQVRRDGFNYTVIYPAMDEILQVVVAKWELLPSQTTADEREFIFQLTLAIVCASSEINTHKQQRGCEITFGSFPKFYERCFRSAVEVGEYLIRFKNREDLFHRWSNEFITPMYDFVLDTLRKTGELNDEWMKEFASHKADHEQHKAILERGRICSVCNGYGFGQLVACIDCGHEYHYDCVGLYVPFPDWLKPDDVDDRLVRYDFVCQECDVERMSPIAMFAPPASPSIVSHMSSEVKIENITSANKMDVDDSKELESVCGDDSPSDVGSVYECVRMDISRVNHPDVRDCDDDLVNWLMDVFESVSVLSYGGNCARTPLDSALDCPLCLCCQVFKPIGLTDMDTVVNYAQLMNFSKLVGELNLETKCETRLWTRMHKLARTAQSTPISTPRSTPRRGRKRRRSDGDAECPAGKKVKLDG